MIMDQKSPSGPTDEVPTGPAPPPAYSAATAGSSTAASQQHMCMSLTHSDRVRLIGCPQATVAAVRDAINAKWRKGIDEDKEVHGAHEFKLHGRPWDTIGSNSITARQLVSGLLAAVYAAGWDVIGSSEMVKKQLERDSIWFRLSTSPQRSAKFFVISCQEGDKIRFTDAPQELIVPVRKLLSGKIQREEWMEGDNAYQWKLEGRPWWGGGDTMFTSRLLLLQLLDTLATFGWELHASVDLSTAGSDTVASDSWYMRKYT